MSKGNAPVIGASRASHIDVAWLSMATRRPAERLRARSSKPNGSTASMVEPLPAIASAQPADRPPPDAVAINKSGTAPRTDACSIASVATVAAPAMIHRLGSLRTRRRRNKQDRRGKSSGERNWPGQVCNGRAPRRTPARPGAHQGSRSPRHAAAALRLWDLDRCVALLRRHSIDDRAGTHLR